MDGICGRGLLYALPRQREQPELDGGSRFLVLVRRRVPGVHVGHAPRSSSLVRPRTFPRSHRARGAGAFGQHAEASREKRLLLHDGWPNGEGQIRKRALEGSGREENAEAIPETAALQLEEDNKGHIAEQVRS